MRALVFTGAGGAEVMRLEERPDPVPAGAEVLVAATHAGINPADALQRAGHYPAPPGSPADVPGLEVAGTVIGCGPGVTRWQEGDRVFGIVGGGGLADRVVVHERCVAAIPDRLDDPAAAAVPEVFITAHDAVMGQAGLRMGETLLVNGAGGGVGTAAVQLGLAMGARVLVTARSQTPRARLAQMGAVPVELGEVDGVDVVCELVGAPNMDANLDALAIGGRIIVVGTGAGATFEMSLRKLMARRGRLLGTGLRVRPLEQKAAAVQAFNREVVPLLETGAVRPIVDRVFPAEEAESAFDALAAPGKFGKLLLRFD
jgi:NADPH:quinone reductase-like Zn-dependent oxidoreductase